MIKRVISILVAITLLLTVINLTSLGKTSQIPTNETEKHTKLSKETMENAENKVAHQNQETTTQASRNPDTQFPTEENNLQTLENPAQNNNIAQPLQPPNGRIYYPTSEEPYAYTPTYTPKEASLPVTPLPT